VIMSPDKRGVTMSGWQRL